MTLQLTPIPGLPPLANQRLLQLLQGCLRVEAVVLFGSRAMGRHRDGSDVDLCLVGEAITHADRLQLMHAIDELLLPWQVDLALQHALPPELLDQINRVGIYLGARHRILIPPRQIQAISASSGSDCCQPALEVIDVCRQ